MIPVSEDKGGDYLSRLFNLPKDSYVTITSVQNLNLGQQVQGFVPTSFMSILFNVKFFLIMSSCRVFLSAYTLFVNTYVQRLSLCYLFVLAHIPILHPSFFLTTYRFLFLIILFYKFPNVKHKFHIDLCFGCLYLHSFLFFQLFRLSVRIYQGPNLCLRRKLLQSVWGICRGRPWKSS